MLSKTLKYTSTLRRFALNTVMGEDLGRTAPRHTSEQFVGFLSDVLARQSVGREIQVICDKFSNQKTEPVLSVLAEHSNVQIHYSPTRVSWFNQVDHWFSWIQRDVISRGIGTSVRVLDRKLVRCIRQGNKNPRPLKRKHDNAAASTSPMFPIQWICRHALSRRLFSVVCLHQRLAADMPHAI